MAFYYLKQSDFTGEVRLPIVQTQTQAYIEDVVKMREKDAIRYVIGNDLGNAFIGDLDTNGNPVSPRFISLDAYLRPAVLRLTYIEIQKSLNSPPTPIGNVDLNDKKALAFLPQLNDLACDYGEACRKYICDNASLYPEFCTCNLKNLRKSIF